MTLRGTNPESYITEYTLVHEDKCVTCGALTASNPSSSLAWLALSQATSVYRFFASNLRMVVQRRRGSKMHSLGWIA